MRELDTVALIPYCPSEGGGEPIVGKESLVLQKAFWITAVLGLCLAIPAWAQDTIKIGFNIEMTGDIPKVGEASKFAT